MLTYIVEKGRTCADASATPRPEVGLTEKAVATQEVIVSGASAVKEARPSTLDIRLIHVIKQHTVHSSIMTEN